MLEDISWIINVLVQTSILLAIGTEKALYLRVALAVFTIYRFRSFIKIISWVLLYIIFSYIYSFISLVLGYIVFRRDVSQTTKNKLVIVIVILQTLAQPQPRRRKLNMNNINFVNRKISSYINFSDLRHALLRGITIEEFHPLRFFIILLVLYAYVHRTPGKSLLTSFV